MSDKQALLSHILTERGILARDQESFLRPDFARDVHDPFLLHNMDKAVNRILAAISSKEKIVVFGDYDADGVPATALLVRALTPLGATIIPIIPLRSDGYGLSSAAVQTIRALGAQLLITVDNGTVAGEHISALLADGIETIVVDHHEPHGEHVAHAAVAMVNPKQAACEYPFKELCACALAWKVAVACYRSLGKDEAQLKWLLDLVAVSTVGDLVPLVGENRTLVQFGLKVFAKTRNLGLRLLSETAGVTITEISAGDIGFKIAPRLNAPSRMHSESHNEEHAALTLLTTEDATRGVHLAEYVNKQNSERQALVERSVREAMTLVGEDPQDLCIVVYDPSWSSGVIGLVASKLVERYKRPAIVLANEDSVIKGSVRSVDGAHALTMLDAAAETLEQYGGHAKAAGLSLQPQGTPEALRAAVNNGLAKLGLSLTQFATSLVRKPDATMTLGDVDLELADALAELEPYGMGFPTPIVRVEAASVGVKAIGKEGQHRSCMLEHEQVQRRAVAWGAKATQLEEGKHAYFDLYVESQEWKGICSVNLVINHVQDLV